MSRHSEDKPRERHQICHQLTDITVVCYAWEAEAARYVRADRRHDSVEVAEAGLLELQLVSVNAVEGRVLDREDHLRVLE